MSSVRAFTTASIEMASVRAETARFASALSLLRPDSRVRSTLRPHVRGTVGRGLYQIAHMGPARRCPKLVADAHASISTTLNIHTHVVDASHRQAVEAVEARLFTDLDPNGPKLAIEPKRVLP
jgi:hypothetical protein